MGTQRISVNIKGIALQDQNQAPVLLLQNEKKQKVFPILIEPSEASSIIMEMEQMNTHRPVTHDIIINFLKKHKFKMTEFEIYKSNGVHHQSRIKYRRGRKLFEMDVKPSDGVALALKLNKPIFISEDLFLKNSLEGTFLSDITNLKHEILYLDNKSFESHIM